ncbi:MAG TPA: hypothetical protein PKI10_15755 [Syntrophorhabdus sp.]|nr:hypothetical protein [Syntrophorhabdus sp.]
MYGIDVPIYSVRLMLKTLNKEMSSKEKKQTSFSLYEGNTTFTIGEYCFSELEDEYMAEKRNANALNSAFVSFATESGPVGEQIPSLADYISANKSKLASFFNKRTDVPSAPPNFGTFTIHAEFLQTLSEKHQNLYQLAEKQFLGSVIASFLESGLDVNAKFSDNVTYYLDTQFILRALDLQQEEETVPAIELIEMIIESGGKLAVLDITMEETNINIQHAIDNFSTLPLLSALRNTSIVHACQRRKLTKTDLQNIHSDINRIISDKIKGNTINTSPSIRDRANASKEHADLKKERLRPATALHDITCIYFVREKRGRDGLYPQKMKYWFLSSNTQLYFFNKDRTSGGTLPEVITPEELASLLWLKNPSRFGKTIMKVGLNEMVAQSLLSSLPSTETLIELDKNLKKYTSITPKQYELLATSLASESINKLRKLNVAASDSPDNFNKEVFDLIEQEKIRREHLSSINEKLKQDSAVIDQAHKKLMMRSQEQLERLTQIDTELASAIKDNTGIQQEKAELEQKADYLQRQHLLKNRIIKYLLIILFLWISYYFVSPMISGKLIKNIFDGIIGLGGLWGFVIMLINIYKLVQKKE